jgi:Mn-dependent DtxR family transcriptional regulator
LFKPEKIIISRIKRLFGLVNLMSLQESQMKLCLALKNPLRCWMIELLKSHRALSSSDLANLLNISLGRCHYHLDNLTGLVKQDKEKRYFLSDEGIRAFQLLVQPRT